MKKFLTLLCLLTCALTGWAAGISETPTTTLTTSYYVIRVFSNKTKADGNLLFFNKSDNTAYTDAPATTNENYDSESIKKYIWKVTVNSDKTIQLSSYIAPTYYFGNWTNRAAGWNHDVNNIMSTTAGNYTVTAAGDTYPNCFYLTTPGKNTTYYVYNQGSANNNATHPIGFWSAEGVDATVAKCCFHAVDFNDAVTITYNIKYNGEKKLTNTIENCLKGCTFPTPTNLPSFVNVTVPSGKVTETKTFDLDATIDMPFKTGNHWYYFSFAEEQGNDHKGYLYNSNYNDATTNYIALGQTSGVTEKKIDNDKYLWRIEGDPFGGFKLYVKDGKHLVTPAVTGNGGTNYPYLATTTPSDQFDTFTLSQYTGSDNTNAVIVRVKDHDTWVMNSRDHKLAYWTGADNSSQGSALRFEDTLPELTLHTLGDKSYATYYLPFAAKAPEGVTAYAGVVNNGSVQLTAFTNGVIPANTGALLVANSDVTTATFTLADNSEATTISNNDLKGVLTTTELSSITNSDQVRIFSKKGDVAGFYKPNTNITTLAANKVYVMAPASSTASLALNFGQEITGIDQVLNEVVENNENNAAIYDLTGRRVAKAVKGVYVKNGKKFIVK